MVMVHVAPGARESNVQVTSLTALLHVPAVATVPDITKKPGAGIESVTVRPSESDGPLLVTEMV